MRNFIARAAMAAFFSVSALFGGATLVVDGFDVGLESNSASARYRHTPPEDECQFVGDTHCYIEVSL